MRNYLLALISIAAVAGIAVPALAENAAKSSKPTGERCVQRVQASDLSAAGKDIAVAACNDRATAVRNAHAALREARKTHRETARAARKAYRAAVEAAAALPEAQREAAIDAARAVRKAAGKAARADLRAARKAHRAAVKAAKQAFKAAIEQARAA